MLILIGCGLLASAHHFGQAVVGMCFAGAGAAIGELTALAGYVCMFREAKNEADSVFQYR